MGRILSRLIVPGLVLAAGVASVIYGAKHHVVPVEEEQEIEVSLAPPPMPDAPEGFPGDPGFPGGFDGPPGMFPPSFMELPPHLATVKQKIIVTNEQPESTIVFEVTIGGVALRETGKLRRTYHGDIPSLCPT